MHATALDVYSARLSLTANSESDVALPTGSVEMRRAVRMRDETRS